MGARILVIDDNAANLELMRYLLEAFGHRPLTSIDGEQGVAAAAREAPDLVLCDVQMAGLDGFGVLGEIRRDPALAGTPVVAVTALAMVGDRDKALASGFDGYLPKPIDPATFVAQVEAFLPPGLRALARKESAATRPAVRPAARPAAARGRTILAVDNHRYNLDLFESLFTASGYSVAATSSAAEALALAREAPPDLILSDVFMPHGSGYGLICAVKADASLRDIPFVFITSTLTNETDRRRGLALGAAAFLFRPIEPQALLREVERCLAAHRRP